MKCNTCAYEPLPFSRAAPDGPTSHQSEPEGSASVSAATPATINGSARSDHSSPAVAKLLETEIDTQCQQAAGPGCGRPVAVARKKTGGPQIPYPVRAMQHKTRLFGPSHWMNICGMVSISSLGMRHTYYTALTRVQFPMLRGLMDKTETDKDSELNQAMGSYKTLARAIKFQRNSMYVFPQIGQHLPQRQIADGLVDCYLRTFETVYRVVHVPTFRTEYERYWESPSTAKTAFVALLQLCMAIGACFIDDTYSLRSSAAKWVYEAQAWLMSPPEKTKMTSTGLQVMCLLQFAKQVAGLGADLTWISAGNLLRTAIYMGLHRDPKHLSILTRTLYSCELRRRLWATILEIVLQSSIDAGGPPLISMCDFDTDPPGNFDDADLVDGEACAAKNKSPAEFSQTSVQIAVLRSFRTRLAVAKHLNDLQSNVGYDAILRLNEELTASCRDLAKQMAVWPRGDVGVPGVSDYQRRFTEWVVNRSFLASHLPRLGQSFTDPTYYFSRKLCLDTALKLSHIANLLPTQPYSKLPGDFDSLIRSGSGPYRQIVFQGVAVIGLEMIKSKEEELAGCGPAVTLGGYGIMLEAAGMSPDDTRSRPLGLDAGFGPFDDDPMDFLTGWEQVVSFDRGVLLKGQAPRLTNPYRTGSARPQQACTKMMPAIQIPSPDPSAVGRLMGELEVRPALPVELSDAGRLNWRWTLHRVES